MIRVSIIQPLPMPQVSNSLYPFNTSLDEEISRLFGYFSIEPCSKPPPSFEDVMEEFRHNGRDSEYCPDFDAEAERETTRRRKKSKKPLPSECVFCRNNGESEAYYTKHCLKDENGIVRCPVLRDYVCPICSATGDHAHTIKYCPKKPQGQTVAIANTFKYLRNSTGKRKVKSPNRVSHQGEIMKALHPKNFELRSVSAAGR